MWRRQLLNSRSPTTALLDFMNQWRLFRPVQQEYLDLLARITGEPRQRCLSIYHQHLTHLWASRLNWGLLSTCSQDKFNQQANRHHFTDCAAVARYLDSLTGGLIIASIHMGDYLGALYKLSRSISSYRQVFILRDKTWSQQEELLFRRFRSHNLTVKVIRHQDNSGRACLRQLRAGHILVMLYDLDHRWGGTTDVDFLGRKMHLVRGPAELAIISRSDILPIMSHYNRRGQAVTQALPVIRPSQGPFHNIEDQTRAITQHLVDLASRQILAHPGQWHHWQLVPQLIHPV